MRNCKSNIKRGFSFLLSMIMALSVFAFLPTTNFLANAEISGDYEYVKLNDWAAQITGYTGSATELEIPSQIEGYTVTAIGDSAFFDCDSLMSITIPDSVTKIGAWSFKNCENLDDINIGNNILSIGKDAFWNTTYYNSIENWEDGVLYLDNYLISGMLIKMTYDYHNMTGSKEETGYKLETSVPTNYEIKEGTTLIADGAFKAYRHELYGSEYNNLENIKIPESVTRIGKIAFLDCEYLKDVIIPKTVVDIGEYAFGYRQIWIESENLARISDFTIYGYDFNCTGCIYADSNYIKYRLVDGAEDDLIYDENPSNYSYDINNDNSIKVTGYSGTSKALKIPSTIDGYSVTAIGYRAFYDGNYRAIIVPEGVTSIGYEAFAYNDSLYMIDLPLGIQQIAQYAFWATDCVEWENLVYYVDDYLVDTDEGADPGVNVSFKIREGTTLIADNAFCRARAEDPITIPNSVRFIGDGALSSWYVNMSIGTIPDTVEYIGDGAFSGTTPYNEETNWENGVLYLGHHLIDAEESIASCTIKEGTKTIASGAFSECGYIKNIVIPDGVVSIGKDAFINCYNLESVTIPNSVKIIGDIDYSGMGSFYGCSSLESVYFKGCISDFEKIKGGENFLGVVVYCNDGIIDLRYEYIVGDDDTVTITDYRGNESDIIVPNEILGQKVTKIADEAFKSNWNVASVTIPEGVTHIGAYAFYECGNLNSISLPDTLKSISYNAFTNCYNLSTVDLPDSITSIGANAFSGCYNLDNIILPKKLTMIDYGTFAGCEELSNITIGRKVETIGYDAFFDTVLSDVYFDGSVTEWSAIQIHTQGNEALLEAEMHYGSCTHSWNIDKENQKKVCNLCGQENPIYIVSFLGKKDALIYEAVVGTDSPYLTDGDITSANELVPDIYGYKIVGWDKGITAEFKIEGNLTIRAVYKRLAETYTTRIKYSDGTTETCDVGFDQRFTIVDEGATAFLIDGQVVGGSDSVSLYGCGELDIVASTDANIDTSKVHVAIMKTAKDVVNGENALRIFTNIYNPENAVVSESGIIVLPGSVYSTFQGEIELGTTESLRKEGKAMVINSQVNANQMLITYTGITTKVPNLTRVTRAYAVIGGQEYYSSYVANDIFNK